jgi:hypothetical protein
MKTTGQIDETLGGPEIAVTTGESSSVAIRRRRKERPATPQEMAAFRAAVAKWRGSATERMKRLGFKSTDEFIDAIRGRHAE